MALQNSRDFERESNYLSCLIGTTKQLVSKPLIQKRTDEFVGDKIKRIQVKRSYLFSYVLHLMCIVQFAMGVAHFLILLSIDFLQQPGVYDKVRESP